MTTESRDRALIRAMCAHCRQPVFAEQGYHAVTGNHWECETQSGKSMKNNSHDTAARGGPASSTHPPSLEQD